MIVLPDTPCDGSGMLPELGEKFPAAMAEVEREMEIRGQVKEEQLVLSVCSAVGSGEKDEVQNIDVGSSSKTTPAPSPAVSGTEVRESFPWCLPRAVVRGPRDHRAPPPVESEAESKKSTPPGVDRGQ